MPNLRKQLERTYREEARFLRRLKRDEALSAPEREEAAADARNFYAARRLHLTRGRR